MAFSNCVSSQPSEVTQHIKRKEWASKGKRKAGTPEWLEQDLEISGDLWGLHRAVERTKS